MQPRLLLGRALVLGTAACLGGTAVSQSNTVNGLNGKLSDIGDARYWGRAGAAFPGGQIGFSVRNTMCNPGTVPIPWFAAMAEDHPKFGFIVARLSGGRLVQISDRSFCKHAFTSLNSNSGACLPCSSPGAPGTTMVPGCSDVYANSNNGDRNWLGPADEIDPWLGTWNHIGSYFDRGDPDVGTPGNTDGVRSLSSTQIAAFNAVKNRVTINETDLQGIPGATYFYQIHLLHAGEAVANRSDNLMSKGVSFSWTGTTWTTADVGVATQGSILSRWAGATLSTPTGNGVDDGRFQVAVQVTGPTNGLWHYEYAVHNIDNSRGAAAFHVPICSSARALNIGFRDIDSNALDQWSATVSGGEIMWNAPASNPLNWNEIFNFWFDSDAAPSSGNVTFDEARIGPGALSVSVATQVPAAVPNVYLGDGCGSPAVTLGANGVASIPNPGFALTLNTSPNTGVLLFASFGTANAAIAPGCTQWIDSSSLTTVGFVLTDPTGNVSVPLAIPPGLPPITIDFQAASIVASGPVLGSFNLSNGLAVRVGTPTCP
jgi:hypothetical protein